MPRPPNPLIEWRMFCLDLTTVPATIVTFDNTMGTPAQCQAWRDHGVIALYQKDFGGTKTERIMYQSRVVYLEAHGRWTGATHEEVAEHVADGVPISANLNCLNVPREMFMGTEMMAETDRDFPSFAGPFSYGLAEEARFDAAVATEVALQMGKAGPQVEIRE